MLFMVTMDLVVPLDFDKTEFERLKRAEKEMFQKHQKTGVWRHIWRVAGQYANVSIFDVGHNGALHDLLTSLPLYPFMTIKVTPLCRHPSSVHEDDR